MTGESTFNDTDRKAMANLFAGNLGRSQPHPHLKVADLSDEMQVRLGKFVCDALDDRDRRGLSASDDNIYLAVLEEFGLDCPHTRRVHHLYYPPNSWDCEICGCAFTRLPKEGA